MPARVPKRSSNTIMDWRAAIAVALVGLSSTMATLVARQPVPGGGRDARTPVQWFVFVDDLHVDFIDTGRLRTMLRGLTFHLFQPGDDVSIAATMSSGAVDRATNADAAAFALRNISGNGLKVEDVLAGGAAPDEAIWRELRSRALVSSTRAQRLLDRGGPITTPRALIYVSGGYLEDADIRTVMSFLSAAAIERGTRIFAFDSKGLGPPRVPPSSIGPDRWARYVAETRGMLRKLAEDTGGFLRDDREDLAQTVARMRGSH